MNQQTDTLIVQKKLFFSIAHDSMEYSRSVQPTEELIGTLSAKHVDIFSFLERKWCCPLAKAPKSWARTKDNIAILEVQSYKQWWESIGKKTRNMIRKAEKAGIKADFTEPDEELAEAVWTIYNETPIRQGRAFPHYGITLDSVKRDVLAAPNSTCIVAYYENHIVGFLQMIHGDSLTIISQILSLQAHWDKAVNNALIAKAIEHCTNNHIRWIMYGRIGNHPTLDVFKKNNGFAKLELTRYYIPLTKKGKLAIRLRLNQDFKDLLPESMKQAIFPVYSWMSRITAKTRKSPVKRSPTKTLDP
jgi:hypothetical protein